MNLNLFLKEVEKELETAVTEDNRKNGQESFGAAVAHRRVGILNTLLESIKDTIRRLENLG